MKKYILAFLFLFFPVLAYSAFSSSSAGTTGAAFLKLGSGARATAMGGAFTAVTAGTSDMIYWNPAGLSAATKKEVSFMYSSYFEDMSYEWVAFAMPTGYGVFGGAFQYMSTGDIEGRDEFGQLTSDFSAYDLAVYLSYARYHSFGNAILDYGLNFKYIYSKIENSASAFAFDFGAIFTLGDGVTSFGAVVQNVGTTLKYDREEEKLPLAVKVGAARVLFDSLLIAVDINFPYDNDVFPSAGAEYGLDITEEAKIFLRAGYDGRQKDVPGFAGFNAGFGLQYRDYLFDYTFSPYGDLGSAHRISAAIRFGKVFDEEEFREKQEQKRKEREANPRKPLLQRIFNTSEAPRPEPANVYEPAPAPVAVASSASETPQESAFPIQQGEEGEVTFDMFEDDVDAETAEQQALAERMRNDELKSVAVVDFFSSKNIPESERAAYSEMLRRGLLETGDLRPVDRNEVLGIYSDTSAPADDELRQIISRTGAERVVVGTVTKTGSKLKFEISVYDRDLDAKKYTVNTEDSFRDAQSKLSNFARKLSSEM